MSENRVKQGCPLERNISFLGLRSLVAPVVVEGDNEWNGILMHCEVNHLLNDQVEAFRSYRISIGRTLGVEGDLTKQLDSQATQAQQQADFPPESG